MHVNQHHIAQISTILHQWTILGSKLQALKSRRIM